MKKIKDSRFLENQILLLPVSLLVLDLTKIKKKRRSIIEDTIQMSSRT
jgi:hypothetical protein